MARGYNPEIDHRRSIRLKGYDYSSAGAYFVTVCTKNKECLFGETMDGTIQLNKAGKLIHQVWDTLASRYTNINLDAFVTMPNHVPGILFLMNKWVVGAGLALPDDEGGVVGAGLALPSGRGAASSAPTLGDVVRTFKSISAMQVNRLLNRTGQSLWQRNYYEHIVRDETSLDRIRDYIALNPQNWLVDPENPAIRSADKDGE